MTSFTFTENKIALIQERFPSLQFEIVSKQCDFCGAALDKEFASETCQCGTVFDQCDECKQSQRYEPGRCHITNHDDPSQVKQLSAEEISVVENREKKEVLRAFGMTTWGRMQIARRAINDEEDDDNSDNYDDDSEDSSNNESRKDDRNEKELLRLDMSSENDFSAYLPALSQCVKDGAEFYIEKPSSEDGSVMLVMKM